MNLINNQTVLNTDRQVKYTGGAKSGSNFGAYNSENIKEDTVNLAKKAGNQIKENWFVSMVKSMFGYKTAKQFFTSVSLAVLTTVGFAYLGNKMSDKTASLGISIDKALNNQGWYKSLTKTLSSAKEKTSKFILSHSKTARDIADTFKNRHAKPVWAFGRGYGRGFVSIFSLTPPDMLGKIFNDNKAAYKSYSALKTALADRRAAKKALKGLQAGTEQFKAAEQALKNASEAVTKLVKDSGCKSAREMLYKNNKGNFSMLHSIKKLTGNADGGRTALEIADAIAGIKNIENRDLCIKLSDAIRKHFKCGNDNEKFLECLKQLKSGKIDINGVKADVSEFTDIVMSDKGFSPIGSWWPVNLIRKGISALTGKKSKLGLGYLGDALIKFNVVNGSLSSSALGRLAQKSIVVPSESISNFVNDKSGLGVFLCAATLKPLFDTLQTAPKEKRTAIAADDLAGTIGSIAVSTPLAVGTVYGLATLNNMKGTTFLGKTLKAAGKVFNIGLDKYSKDGNKIIKNIPNFKDVSGFLPKTKVLLQKTGRTISGYTGGIGRIWLSMFVLGGIFAKPVRKAIHKVFGKPSDDNQNPLVSYKNQKIIDAQNQELERLYQDRKKEALLKSSNNKGGTNVISRYMQEENSQENKQTEFKNYNQLYPQMQQQMYYQGQYNPYMNASYNNIPQEMQYAQPFFQNSIAQPQIINPVNSPEPQQNDIKSGVIASSRLKTDSKNEHTGYVPSIQVDNSYAIEEENALNKQVSGILKSTDARISRISKSLHG